MSNKKKIFWQLFPSYLLIIIISLLLITMYSSKSFKHFYRKQILNELQERAYLLENKLHKDFFPLNPKALKVLSNELSRKILTRITIVSPTGEVIADTEETPEGMNNHLSRPEIQEALKNGLGTSTRFSDTLKRDMVYVAVPVRQNGNTAGIIRTAMPLTLIKKTLTEAYIEIILGGLIIALVAGVINYNISKKISIPLEKLEKGAKDFADGNLKNRLPDFSLEEINNVAKSMNGMAEQLNRRMQIITRQNRELEIILSSMKSGLIVIDNQKRLRKINKSASELFKLDIDRDYKKKIETVIIEETFYQFIKKALALKYSVEEELIFSDFDGEKIIQIYSMPIYSDEEERNGTLIVLNDITHIKKLENIRQDFVSNVSHELKTPITSIQGFVETLLDDDLNNPEEIKNYLAIIKKHTGRLKGIIEDLLSLSRLEQDSGKSEISFATMKINDILTTAIQACQGKANAKNIKINLICDTTLQCCVNPLLMEQAIMNLIDNSIKYSKETSKILVEALKMPEEIIIKVQDYGCGISEEHLPRLFERFYRVDKSRSRVLGGTGLGLSIVKHIIQAHNGHINVKSVVEEGSTFYIHLPHIK